MGELLTLLICMQLEKATIYIYLVTEKEYGWSRDLGSRASSSVKYSHDP